MQIDSPSCSFCTPYNAKQNRTGKKIPGGRQIAEGILEGDVLESYRTGLLALCSPYHRCPFPAGTSPSSNHNSASTSISLGPNSSSSFAFSTFVIYDCTPTPAAASASAWEYGVSFRNRTLYQYSTLAPNYLYHSARNICCTDVPSLMPLPSQMMLLRKCTLEVLGTLYTIKFPKARSVLTGNQGLVLFELAGIAEVGVDLINITMAGVSAVEEGHK